MFGEKFLKTTVLALCGAFAISFSSGTAQASVADKILAVRNAETVSTSSDDLREIRKNIDRERREIRRHERGKHHRNEREHWRDHPDWRDYPPPPPPHRR